MEHIALDRARISPVLPDRPDESAHPLRFSVCSGARVAGARQSLATLLMGWIVGVQHAQSGSTETASLSLAWRVHCGSTGAYRRKRPIPVNAEGGWSSHNLGDT